MEPNRGKGLILLRFCNESLKRLSKSGYMELCGRIMTFLSLAYPLTERSGVNLKGEFNTENTTVYDEDVVMDDPQPEKRVLYQTIWGLQKFFSNPPLLFQPGNLELFQKVIAHC
jgi:THO complex subunit 1